MQGNQKAILSQISNNNLRPRSKTLNTKPKNNRETQENISPKP